MSTHVAEMNRERMRTNTGAGSRRFKAGRMGAWRRSVRWAVAGGLLLAFVGPAQAIFHFMSIVEVFGGTPAAPQAQYVMLQMYAPGQNIVGGHDIKVFNAAGAQVARFVFPGSVANGANQARILIATPQAEAFFGVQADLEMSAAMLAAGGKVCFADTIDCVAWGSYSGSSAGVGTPFNVSGGLVPGRAAVRRRDIAGGSTTLDAADDTNNCAVDFVVGLPAPRNNNGTLGSAPSSTCGNGYTEGLEQCDDGNTANGDSCSSTCMVTAPTYRPKADYNNDGRSDATWRNGQNGANVIWRSANAATQQAVAGVSNPAWRVVGIGDFDGNGQADLLWRNASNGANTIWRGANAASQQAVATVPASSWKIVGVGDFDNDGRDDIVWRNDASGANSLWRSGNAATQLPIATVANGAWRIVGVGDFNGDGRSDLLWRNDNGSNVVWRSASHQQSQAVATASTGWRVVGVGDFNGDGSDDILWRNVSSGANAIWRSANAATSTAMSPVPNTAWRVVAVGDYNGDRRSDVFWRNASSGGNTIWLSANSGTQQATAAVSNLAWAIVP